MSCALQTTAAAARRFSQPTYLLVKRWFETMQNRPAVIRAYEKGQPYSSRPTVNEESKKILFGQTAASIQQPQG